MNCPESENQYIEFKQSFNVAVIETLVAFADIRAERFMPVWKIMAR
ncbi:hypothetical protein [uncultured Parabacteroides sp.]|nr:hypothetical protein [uncultured Parabacteroides sp.]